VCINSICDYHICFINWRIITLELCAQTTIVLLSTNQFIDRRITINKWAPTPSPHSRNIFLRRKNTCGLAVTFTFDLWPWKPFQQYPLTWWIFTPRFSEIRPLITEISRHAKYVLNGQQTDREQTDGWTDVRKHNASAAYCWRLKQKKHFVKQCNILHNIP